MPIQLKNMAITFLSLVKKGANDRKIIIKSGDDKPTIEFKAPIMKIDPDKRRFFSIVYPANEVDKQGEFATPEEIQKAAYGFMRNLRLLNIDKNHSYVAEDAYVAESWIVQKNDPTFPDEPEGSWAVGIIVEDDETWNQVEKGEIEAISMGGTGDKVLDIKDDNLVINESVIKKIVKKTVKKILKKGGGDMDEKKVQEMIDESVKKAIEALPKPLTTEEMATVVKEAIKPVTDRVEKIEKESKGSRQDDDDIKKDADLEKVGADIAKMVNEG